MRKSKSRAFDILTHSNATDEGVRYLAKGHSRHHRQRSSRKPGRFAPTTNGDAIVGGPPCQGFSQNGKRLLDDPRNKLLSNFVALINSIKPKCAIIENVPTALSAWEKIFDEEIGSVLGDYIVKMTVLNASQFGVPQIRRRAFIVAIRRDLTVEKFGFPSGEFNSVDIGHDSHRKRKAHLRFVSTADAIGDLPALKAGEAFDGMRYPTYPTSQYQAERRAGSLGVFNHVARAHSKEFLSKISVIRPGKGNAHLPDEKRFSDNYYSQAYARLHRSGIAFTITAHFRNPGSGRFTHYRDRRSLTVREAARLQSFDDRFIFHGYDTDQERHVGNAVPPLVSKALALHFGAIVAGIEPREITGVQRDG